VKIEEEEVDSKYDEEDEEWERSPGEVEHDEAVTKLEDDES